MLFPQTSMIKVKVLTFCLPLLFIGCNSYPDLPKEQWVDKPVSEWPRFALTNKISFSDTTYENFANSFLVDTGLDTIGVSCKHLFMVFQNQLGFNSIDLGSNFESWSFYPKNDNLKKIETTGFINRDTNEPIGQYNTLKVRDWIIFHLGEKSSELYPLKIRYSPVKKGETVYAVGWGALQKDNRHPAKISLKCFKSLKEYFYIQPQKTETKPHGRSGSPVIDSKGYLVGIVSGQEGSLGVIGSVNYLVKLFEKYDIRYKKTDEL